jgi:hypothetical protein
MAVKSKPALPVEVIAASEAFRTQRDAARYRFLKAHPSLGRILQYQRREDVDTWIDAQMRAKGVLK